MAAVRGSDETPTSQRASVGGHKASPHIQINNIGTTNILITSSKELFNASLRVHA